MNTKIIPILVLALLAASHIAAEEIDWSCNPYDYQHDMTAYVTLTMDGEEPADLSRYTVGAFCGDECRGLVAWKNSNGHTYGYLRIRSNQAEGDTVSFRVFDTETTKIAKSGYSVVFKSMGVIGYPSSPAVIDAYNPYTIKFSSEVGDSSETYYYGDTIAAPNNPVKEGYTFNGWDSVPVTMPANDVTVTGSFSINKYAVLYYVDEELFYTDSITYNDTITLIKEPTKEGYKFSGWSDVPDLMPANDISVYGTFNTLSGIRNAIYGDNKISVYSLNGSAVLRGVSPCDALKTLRKGIYIVNGRKIIVAP